MPHIIIIGAGVQGLSTAYWLTRLGHDDLTVIEAGEAGVSGSTPRSAAMLVQQTNVRATTSLAVRSVSHYEDIQSTTADLGFNRSGGLLFSTTSKGQADLAQQAAMQVDLGLPTEELTPSAIHARFGDVVNADGLTHGLFCPSEGYLDPHKLLSFYLSVLGSRVKSHLRAEAIELEGDQVVRVRLIDGTRLDCPIVVNAAGAYAKRLASTVHIHLPIRSSERGLVIINRADLVPPTHPLVEDYEGEWYFRPHPLGVLFGLGPRVDVDDADSVDEPAFREEQIAEFDAYLRERMPAFLPYTIIKKWAGYRPLLSTEEGACDDFPILGPSRLVRGYYNCCGAGAYGVTLGSACGEIVANSILAPEGAPRDALSPFSSDRFETPTKAAAVQSIHWPRDQGGAPTLDGDRLTSYVERFGAPLYVYDLSIVAARLHDLRLGLPGFDVSYAIKANPNADVCSYLAENGVSAGVSSLRDLEVALRAGFLAADADFVGPGKDRAALDAALDHQLGLVSVESLAEAQRLDALAVSRGVRVRVLLRVNTTHRATGAGEIMAGVASQFGVDEEQIPQVARALSATNIDVVGFHTFVASQVLNYDFLAFHFERVADTCLALAEQCEVPLEVLNFGGGFGVPYSSQERGLRLEDLGAEIMDGPAGELARNSGTRCIIDVGRYLLAEAGLFLTRVVDVKVSRGSRFVVVESGISGMARPAMPWGQQHPIALVGGTRTGARDTYTIVGPSCMPGDVLCQSVPLSRPRPGDIIAVYNAGAYGLTMSPLAWGGFAPPKELTVGLDGEELLAEVAVLGVY